MTAAISSPFGALPNLGELPASGYRVITQLAEGGTANVFLAVAVGATGFSRMVVLKVLKGVLARERETQQMFLEEARICSMLAHQNVVQISELVLHDGLPAIVMPYIEGRTLSDVTARLGAALPLLLHLRVLVELLDGLHYAHELCAQDGSPLGLIHRDVSPHNVLIGFDGAVKVLDFGIAKIAGVASHTQSGAVKGKLRYMAPEQLAGGALDRRVDVFGAGVMLWEALTGRRLWQDQPDAAIARRLLTAEVPAPSSVEPSCPPELDRIARRALAPLADERYADARTMRDELEAYLEGKESRKPLRELGELIAEAFRDDRAQLSEQTRALLMVPASTLVDESGMFAPALPEPTPLPRWALVAVVLLAGSAVAVPLLIGGRAVTDGGSPSGAVPLVARGAPTSSALGPERVRPSLAAVAPASAVVASTSADPPAPLSGAARARVGAAAPFGGPPSVAPPSAGLPSTGSAARPPVTAPSSSGAAPLAPAKPAASNDPCQPPFYFDARGVKRFKPECL